MKFSGKKRLLGAVLGVALVTPAVWASSNGRLAPSELAPIYHPTYTVYLRKDAAAAWNAMRDYCRARGTDLYPNGKISAYRTYDEQVEAKRIYGKNAATPGTSNHGLGLAVDVATPAMRQAIDRYGASFGWAKKWSDASWEWWHLKYRTGVWSGSSNGSTTTGNGSSNGSTPTPGFAGVVLSRGSSGSRVVTLQRALVANGAKLSLDGDFGPATEAAVKDYQRRKGLHVDGVAGPDTLRSLGLATT